MFCHICLNLVHCDSLLGDLMKLFTSFRACLRLSQAVVLIFLSRNFLSFILFRWVPQGTRLGSWLFITMIDDLVVPSANGTVKYVDDTTVYEVVDSREVSQAQNAVNDITQ